MNINLTLISQMIAFAIFVAFCMKYVWPPIMKALDERATKIAEGLAAAERGQQEQEIGRQKALEEMKAAKAKAADIVAQAQKRYNEVMDEAKRDAQGEADRIKTAAHAEIEQETNRAREELRERMAALAVAAAEKVLEKEIDASAHKALIDSFAKQL
ncbi:F0F1 ATP synthase subunit B [Lamprobacter modestohalophilus]|jgi:F-type H+-transporting ATPase subunit b|uniref:ATP synthase subunit b n=1 Tax=Lamprobacter modestohalophilus TaxID=1064514 RepID=A0A9X0WB11_9GAMM|nr:F0F1 ATP synthase subunit B [Lamprobacter modestohalophilus]MCF7977534.1 F0F1 ATP synthase subunit B [Chromatiaceae bacterium]MBK1619910.1 F0F1 ATP synthase subunit B [Lamprobacter modestohalophilus]MCF7995077.1 F0F1 ATP synthase subunit B [Chromatiaceae bacterium]MCF8004178.1 F0F1 ATP synthase subunit B [Chromatiaceae bacterium]MCF8014199.1 F0F1 ATP synthase subunit B [Chromatiaceae bacterium]